jgi:hypothetical protein
LERVVDVAELSRAESLEGVICRASLVSLTSSAAETAAASAAEQRRERSPEPGAVTLLLPRRRSEIPDDLGYLIRPIPEPPTDFDEFVCLEDQFVPAWRVSGNGDAPAPPEFQ